MQVTESLSLGTPFIGIYYRGCFEIDELPKATERFLHATTVPRAEPATVAAAERMLRIQPADLAAVHSGGFEALQEAADFMEALPPKPRKVSSEEWTKLGYPRGFSDRLAAACLDGASFQMEDCRVSRIRRLEHEVLDSVVLNLETGGQSRSLALWTRIFNSDEKYQEESSKSRAGEDGRVLVFADPSQRCFVEYDRGERLLPPIH